MLDLFPDYLPGWRRYYLFHSDVDRFAAAPIIADGTLHRSLNDRILEHSDGTRQKAVVVETSGDDAFPEAVAIAVQEGNQTVEAGTVLVRRSIDEGGGLRDRWTVGVDFGTSNTNVYDQREGDPARPLRIDFGGTFARSPTPTPPSAPISSRRSSCRLGRDLPHPDVPRPPLGQAQ